MKAFQIEKERQQFSGFLKDTKNTDIDTLSKYISNDCFKCFQNKEKRMRFTKGQIVMSQFEKKHGVYIVISGLVKLAMQDENGNELTVGIKKTGDIFSDSCFFNKGENTYSFTATMFQSGEVIFIHSKYIEKELKVCPYLSEGMMRCLSEQVEDYASRLFEMAHLDNFSKTVKTINKLVKKFGKRHVDEIYIDLPLTIQEFAGLVGASRESISRVFSELQKDNVVEIRNKKIFITNKNKFFSYL